jgi:hypothetical protein
MVSWLANYIDMSCHLPYIGYIYRSSVALSITEKGRLELGEVVISAHVCWGGGDGNSV